MHAPNAMHASNALHVLRSLHLPHTFRAPHAWRVPHAFHGRHFLHALPVHRRIVFSLWLEIPVKCYSVALNITRNTEPFNFFFGYNKRLQMLFRLVLQENEKLKDESTEKTKKIETLNDKISDLLQKNQR